MILNPAIIALIFGSILVSLATVYAAAIGIQIRRQWDINSGSELQLQLERKTYLISNILAYVLAFELISLFLFVYTADHIHDLFVGAMCAAGSLNVNMYGYPTLVVKTVSFLLCGVWMLINYTDNQAADYPLIKPKYRMLQYISALILLESYFQYQYFAGLRADVITSCCGTLFGEDAPGIAGSISGLPPYTTMVFFFLSIVLTIRVGIHFILTGKAAKTFSLLSLWMLIISVISIISFIAVYYYELPTHHCPFCILQKDYSYIGYALYVSLFGATISGAFVGVLQKAGLAEASEPLRARLQKRFCFISIGNYVIFIIISVYPIIFSDFRLIGY